MVSVFWVGGVVTFFPVTYERRRDSYPNGVDDDGDDGVGFDRRVLDLLWDVTSGVGHGYVW